MNRKIFYGAPVYTMDSGRSVRQAVAVVDGKIERVGDNPNEMHNLYPDAELVQFSEGCVIPGFVDAHLHLKEYSLLFRDFDLTAAEQTDDLLSGVRSVVSEKENDEWLWAAGAARHLLINLFKQDLDSVTASHPAVVFSRDLGVALANSAALARAGIDDSRSDPFGGKIGRDRSGSPNGLLFDRAVELVRKAFPDETDSSVGAAVEKAVNKILSYGITTACDCSTRSGSESVRTLMELQLQNRLKARVLFMFGERDASKLGEVGFVSQFGTDRLRLGGFSVVIDGSFSMFAACMRDGYGSGASNGMLLMDEEELFGLFRTNFSRYFWGAVQCVGDGATEIALKVFNRIKDEPDIPRLLTRIDMASALKDQDITAISRNEVIPVMVPGQIISDREWAIRNLGSETRLLYRFKSLLGGGARLAFATDAPYSSIDPLNGIYCAVERRGWGEGPEFRFYPKEGIPVGDAVAAFTTGSARAVGMDGEVGSIEPGKRADLVHLSHDIFTDDAAVIKRAKVMDVYVDGERAPGSM